MFRQNLRRLVILMTAFVILGATTHNVGSTPNLVSILNDFFSKQLGMAPIKLAHIPSPADEARWYDRAVARNLWRDNFIVKKDFLEHLLDNGALSDVIGISSGSAGLDPTNPDIAYDPTNSRYLVVWEEETEPGVFNILGQFRDRSGTPVGSPVTISSPRTNQGCFYANFDRDNGDISVSTDCSQARNPAVAFNNGRYLVAWELQGRANSARNWDGSDYDVGRNFVNIIAKEISASDLSAVSPDWEEGILISKIWVASNMSTDATNDSQVQAWSRSMSPDVAPKLGSDGFVVTWQTNKDFIGCVDPNRRDSTSIYARYIDQNFSSSGGSTNKPIFAVSTDPSIITSTCPTLDNVMRAQKPRIAFNSAQGNFVIAFEYARAASATQGDIGAKKVSLSAGNDATVTNSMMPELAADAADGTTFQNPDLASFGGNVVLAYDDGSNVFLKNLSTASGEVAAVGDPTQLALSGSAAKTAPSLGGNVGVGGTRSPATSDPQRILVTYTQGGALKGTVVDNTFAITRAPFSISNTGTAANHVAEVASDLVDFFVAWAGVPSGMTSDQVFGAKVVAVDAPGNQPPTVPALAADPADGVTWAPTRLYLSWSASTDPDAGDTVVYDVYFKQGASPATLYKSGITDTHFVIQASTDNRTAYNPDGGVTPIFLAPSSSYKWKICARDNHGASACSPERTFNTDNSVEGWWRFDEDPTGPVCSGGAAGETVCDYSGNNNHGVPNGGVTWLPPPAPGILGGALSFDGTSGYVSVVNDPSLNITNQVSIATIVKPAASSAIRRIASKLNDVSPFNGYDLDINNATNKFRVAICNSTCPQVESGTVVTNGTLYSVVGTYDQVNMKIYVNGALDGTAALTGNIGTNTFPFYIGKQFTSDFYKGSIQDVILFNKSLDVKEVQNYNSSSTP